jgi:branched-chain amino acid transport system substrate-binding protein
MVGALEGYRFDSVKGQLTVRAEDHALLQPMFQAKLNGTAVSRTGEVSATDAAPPVAAMKG